jgi:hypothetical protein
MCTCDDLHETVATKGFFFFSQSKLSCAVGRMMPTRTMEQIIEQLMDITSDEEEEAIRCDSKTHGGRKAGAQSYL